MSGIVVLAPGAMTTVQDLGRPGLGAIGVSASGAADPVSLRAANRLAGNEDGAPAFEIALGGAAFAFEEDAVIAVAGADLGATIDGRAVPGWSAAAVARGERLRFGFARRGARAYLAVAGGIDAPRVFGSASVHVWSGLGGRPARRDDRFAIGGSASRLPAASADAKVLASIVHRDRLRVTWSPQAAAFGDEARALFLETPWEVAEAIDRMGLRLLGPEIAPREDRELPSEGAPLGAIQIAGGRPIVLFVEHQTTGGYPKIANVIAADLPALGQLRPRDRIRFESVRFEEAREILLAQERAREEAFR